MACDSVAHCAAGLSCAGPGTSQCSTCSGGYTLVNGTADVCTGTCTLVASADGEADNWAGNSSNGTDDEMRTTDDGVSHYYSMLKFDLQNGTCEEGYSVPSGITVTSATITLTLTNRCGTCQHGHSLRRITAAWTEGTIPTNTGPSATSTVSASFTAPSSTPTAVNVSGGLLVSDIQGFINSPSTNQGWNLRQNSGVGNAAGPFRWATREHATVSRRPRLVITY
jgi:hypothetical protein